MTDLERAAEVVDEMGREIGDDRVFWPETWRRKIQAALAAARREGAEDMRKRAAVLEAALRKIASLDKHSGSSLRTRAASEIAREALRALPLTPEEPQA